ncbi:hypothetical protein AA958_07035 [Streptomyces sp. CNQ-509]|uniref:hypothetical protein n=1 Tax=unclassified Streptomyces TaxID=2593676 RepID=UPI00062DD530|nr:hypothetical protein [Streptomyces sp. CNQ-509]AKH82012.1 hypothetical protein AA958_07035 [Streptomyces sp. CNQ-509]
MPSSPSSSPSWPPHRPTVAGLLRTIEGVLLRGEQRTARRNAWDAVLEDRRRASARRESESAVSQADPSAGGTSALPR